MKTLTVSEFKALTKAKVATVDREDRKRECDHEERGCSDKDGESNEAIHVYGGIWLTSTLDDIKITYNQSDLYDEGEEDEWVVEGLIVLD